MGKRHRKKQELQESNSGIGAIEMILIFVVLIGLVLILKPQLLELVAILFERYQQ